MHSIERRAEARIRPPRDAVLDFALWLVETPPPLRLSLSALGPPDVSRRTGQELILVDVASIGLGIRVSAQTDLLERLESVPALYLYLKLREYTPQSERPTLSLFFHVSIARTGLVAEGRILGLRVQHLGRGSSFEKALELLDVSRFGAKELAAWIDTLRQAGLGQETGVLTTGLDLDRLLDEPELLRENV